LSRAWRVFIATFPKVFLITLGFTVVVTGPSLMMRNFQPSQSSQAALAAQLFGWIAVAVVAWIILYTLGEAAVLYMAFQSMRGRLVSVVEALRKGLSRFWAIVGLAIQASLGIWVGLILLVVPGIMLAVRWSVALPACVVEGLSP
jgi:ABC-type phosphate transport system permease subunit